MNSFIKFFNRKFSINTKGQVVKPNGHKVSIDEVFKTYRDAMEEAGMDVSITADDIKQYVEENSPEPDEEDSGEFDLENYILGYIKRTSMTHTGLTEAGEPPEWRIDPGFRQIETIKNGVPVPSDINQLQAAIRTTAIKSGLGKIAKSDDIKTILADLSRRYGAQLIAGISNSLRYNPECVAEGDLFLVGLKDMWQIRQRQEIVNAVMRHFIWQVKRKLLGLPVVWPIWINYYGGSSLGKTTMINDIGKPLKDFAIMTTITELLDEERQVMKLCSTYFINIDELTVETKNPYVEDGSLTKSQNAALKKLLTQEKSRTRNMGGQSQSTRRYTFSVISSANEHLYDIIYDDKTMRRYYELVCQRDKIDDYTKLDELKQHIMALWKSVDENKNDGYLNPACDVWAEIQAEQLTYYPTNTNTRYWLADNKLEVCDENVRESLMSLYDEYKMYCKEHGNNPKNFQHWTADIRHLVPGCSLNTNDPINVRIVPKEAV